MKSDVEILEETVSILKGQLEKKDEVMATMRRLLQKQNTRLRCYEWQPQKPNEGFLKEFTEILDIEGNIAKD